MAKIEVGKQYGCWLVLERNDQASKEYSEKQKHKRNVWNCECVNCHIQRTKSDYVLQNCERKGYNKCADCPPEDLTGKRIGRLTVRGPSPNKVYGKNLWICDCDCGKVVEHDTGTLNKKNPPQSCGCLQREIVAKRNTENGKWNGDSKNSSYERLYRIWRVMHHRCEFENDIHYDAYGGRGIKVCNEWKDWVSFKKWALNNGYEDHLTIDRINTNGIYEPGNCRWTTPKVQANNMRSNKYLTYQGRTQTLSQWCDELGIDYFRTKARLNTCGYSVEEAFEQEKYYFQKNVQHKGNKANMITDA